MRGPIQQYITIQEYIRMHGHMNIKFTSVHI